MRDIVPCVLFQRWCQIALYLATALTGPTVAKCSFWNKQFPSLEEEREGDCARINEMVPYEQKAPSVKRQPVILACSLCYQFADF